MIYIARMAAGKPLYLQSPRQRLFAASLLALVPFFFLSPPAWFLTGPGIALTNLAHVLVFFLITSLLKDRVQLTKPRQWLALTLAVLAVSMLIELLQTQVGRSASWHDGLRNLAGSWLALFWLQKPGITVWAGRIVSAALLMAEIGLLVFAAGTHLNLGRQLPMLANLEQASGVQHWRAVNSEIDRSQAVVSEGRFSLKVSLQNAPFSGVALETLAPNWKGFGHLALDIHNGQQSNVPITLRIHDFSHRFGDEAFAFSDRFNYSLNLQPGWNHIHVPLQDIQRAPASRAMDLSRIEEIRLFTDGKQGGKVLHLDNLRLVK